MTAERVFDHVEPVRRGAAPDGRVKIVRAAAELPREAEVGLVPTMGAFHDGHVALFTAARAENDFKKRKNIVIRAGKQYLARAK